MFRRIVRIVLHVLGWPLRVAERRRILAALGEMDDRGLADIGLTRQDLRDATAAPSGADPSLLLADRAREREALERRRRRAATAPPRMAAE